jgi:acetyl-CoA carboxylase carboxyl transferase subunit beta
MTREVTEAAVEWLCCPGCRALVYGKRLNRGSGSCPECGWHHPLTADRRLATLLDPGYELIEVAPQVTDPLGFADTKPYAERLRAARAATGLTDAVQVAVGAVSDLPVVVAVMDFRFLGGSLGVAAGEAVTVAAEEALAARVPLVLVTASGGARMQEGALALMQLAKTSQAMAGLDEAGLLTVCLVTDPTYGGVAASFATLADVIIAEPGARLGFAGPRVIEQTLGKPVPPDFQRAEKLLERGLIDGIVPRQAQRAVLTRLLGAASADRRGTRTPPPRRAGAQAEGPARAGWDAVRLARHPDRPSTMDYIARVTEQFQELHGDRAAGDCAAVVGGPATLAGRPVMVIGLQKGHTTKELVRRNFGMASPSGYRKAARMMRLAQKIGIGVLTLIDTPGADPSVGSEERGQAHALAETIRLMSGLRVPTVSVIIGEGGSGGALALAVTDRVLMCANAVYSVISPEGCAAILWKSARFAPDAANTLRLDAAALHGLGVVDGVIPEPEGGAHHDPAAAADLVSEAVSQAFDELAAVPPDQLVARRRARFRKFGVVENGGVRTHDHR